MIPSLLLLASLWAASAAQDQPTTRQADWPCAARPDPSHVKVAEGSGGQVFLLDPSELGESAVLALGPMRHEQTLFRVAGSVEPGLHEFTFPVDGAVESAFFSVWLQCLQVVEIVRPSGEPLRSGDPVTADHGFQAGRVITVARPEPGTWRVHVAGRGQLFVVIRASSELSLSRVQFVEDDGRTGEAGVPAAPEPPVRGRPQRLSIALDGAASDVRARLVTARFEDIAPVPLEVVSSRGEEQEFAGRVTPPAAGFRVVVSGRDARGLPFQRVHGPLLEAVARAPSGQ